ncbi:hypothetical protein NQU49_26640, partial [Escherichia coli]|uniref:hypothetical protein n=1 Tax=Escherichia coli TaxID=562 RepID=UPI0021184891
EGYLTEQIALLIRNHAEPVSIGDGDTPIPLHFAFPEGIYVDGTAAERLDRPLRDIFDVPDLASTDDRIVNGNYHPKGDEALPLAP